jgi:hypothetical protein
MNADVNHAAPTNPALKRNPLRSTQSLAFERYWHSLPKQGLIPHKRDFTPAGMASLLRNVMLLEVSLEPVPSFQIRLVGGAIQERIQRDVKGRDYLEFLPPDVQEGAVTAVRYMFDHPCGLWQITPLHFERGISVNLESTVFPLMAEPSPFVLAIGLPRDDRPYPQLPDGKPLLITTAPEYCYLDVGAGVPKEA